MKLLTVIICTHNRYVLLKKCLDSIISQPDFSNIETLVVDNNSSDSTSKLVNNLSKKYTNLEYLFEKQTGLSYARNSGWMHATTEWVFFLDDDAQLLDNTLEEILKTIKLLKTNDIAGCIFHPLFIKKKPKWLNVNSVSNQFMDVDGKARLLSFPDFAYGGVLLCHRSLLQQINGFSAEYGMKGKFVGYGEEIDMQQRARKKGCRVWLYPNIRVNHVVLPGKYSLIWQIKSAYSQGKSRKHLLNLNNKPVHINMIYFPYLAISLFLNTIIEAIKHKELSLSTVLFKTLIPLSIKIGERT